MIIVNTQDESLIELLADQVFIMSRNFKFMKLDKNSCDEKYIVHVAIKCSESPEDTLFSLSMDLENEQIEVRVVSR